MATSRRMTATQRERPGGDDRYEAIDRIMARSNYAKDSLLDVLSSAQEAFGNLSEDMLVYVADRLDLPTSHVYGVATFYDTYSLDKTGETQVRVCVDPACAVAGSAKLIEETVKHIGASGPGKTSPDGRYSVRGVRCLGLCDQAPAALVGDTPQVNLSVDDIPAMLRAEAAPSRIQVSGEPRVLTAPIGTLDPTDLDAHRAAGAFTALEKALREMTPEEVIKQVKVSNLAGRGGAGFPTGLKWQFTRQAADETKYMVCNFDESEPGTFKDRALMEGNPFRVIEGLLLGGYATGAKKGYIFIRAEYQTATAVVAEALGKLRAAGLLGENILGTGFDFDIKIRHNAGAYICGEETALFEAIEGKRGEPRTKPPYPTQSGLFGKPTAINNVETLAVIPDLIEHGGEWLHQWGTEKSVGLRLFCLSGHVNQPGVIEAPYGITVRELIERFGGGFDGAPQAVLVGGAAGSFLTPEQLDTPLTHEDLAPLNAPIGSGVIMVFNETVNLLDVLEVLADFFVHESCGQCAPCRLGTRQVYNILHRITGGSGQPEDVDELEKLCVTLKTATLCGLGQSAPNPVLSTLNYFRHTYEALIPAYAQGQGTAVD
jgi:NADH-quinone oxidoreductase subunit F